LFKKILFFVEEGMEERGRECIKERKKEREGQQ